MTQPQQNQQGSPATPIRPAATTYDRGEFADGEWGVVDAAQLTPQERLAVQAATTGANRPGMTADGKAGR